MPTLHYGFLDAWCWQQVHANLSTSTAEVNSDCSPGEAQRYQSFARFCLSTWRLSGHHFTFPIHHLDTTTFVTNNNDRPTRTTYFWWPYHQPCNPASGRTWLKSFLGTTASTIEHSKYQHQKTRTMLVVLINLLLLCVTSHFCANQWNASRSYLKKNWLEAGPGPQL